MSTQPRSPSKMATSLAGIRAFSRMMMTMTLLLLPAGVITSSITASCRSSRKFFGISPLLALRSTSTSTSSSSSSRTCQLQMSALSGPHFRVSNLEKSISFYSNVFGMKVLQQHPEEGATLTLDEDGKSALALHLLPAGGAVDIGDAYSGIGIKMLSATQAFEAAAKEGGKVVLEVGNFAYAASLIPDEDEMKNTPVRYGRLADPDGYLVEVREDAKMDLSARKLFKMVMNVLDVDESVAFYSDHLGMNLLRRRSNVYNVPKEASMCAYVGYADEVTGPYLELHYNYATDKLEMGSGFKHAEFKAIDVGAIAERAKAAGRSVETIGDGKVLISDPSGYPVLISASWPLPTPPYT